MAIIVVETGRRVDWALSSWRMIITLRKRILAGFAALRLYTTVGLTKLYKLMLACKPVAIQGRMKEVKRQVRLYWTAKAKDDMEQRKNYLHGQHLRDVESNIRPSNLERSKDE